MTIFFEKLDNQELLNLTNEFMIENSYNEIILGEQSTRERVRLVRLQGVDVCPVCNITHTDIRPFLRIVSLTHLFIVKIHCHDSPDTVHEVGMLGYDLSQEAIEMALLILNGTVDYV